MVAKTDQQIIKNQIGFWIGLKWKIVIPTRLQPSEPGPRGGVGEGSGNCLPVTIGLCLQYHKTIVPQ